MRLPLHVSLLTMFDLNQTQLSQLRGLDDFDLVVGDYRHTAISSRHDTGHPYEHVIDRSSLAAGSLSQPAAEYRRAHQCAWKSCCRSSVRTEYSTSDASRGSPEQQVKMVALLRNQPQ